MNGITLYRVEDRDRCGNALDMLHETSLGKSRGGESTVDVMWNIWGGEEWKGGRSLGRRGRRCKETREVRRRGRKGMGRDRREGKGTKGREVRREPRRVGETGGSIYPIRWRNGQVMV